MSICIYIYTGREGVVYYIAQFLKHVPRLYVRCRKSGEEATETPSRRTRVSEAVELALGLL